MGDSRMNLPLSTRLKRLPLILVLLHTPLAIAFCLTALPGRGENHLVASIVAVVDFPAIALAWFLTFDFAPDWPVRGASLTIWWASILGAGGVQWYVIGRLSVAALNWKSRPPPRPVPLYRRRRGMWGVAAAVGDLISNASVFVVSFWFAAIGVENLTPRQTVRLPVTVALGFAACMTALNAVALRRRRRRASERKRTELLEIGLCPVCGYDLSGLPTNRCPECGEEFPEWARRPPPGPEEESSQSDQ